MIIDKNLSPYIIFYEASIAQALQRIIENRTTVIFAVNEENILKGLFTNGDFLRWVVKQPTVDLNRSLEVVLNKNYIYATDEEDYKVVATRLKNAQYIPIVDQRHRLTAIARFNDGMIRIGPYALSKYSPAFIVAEIGINHNGSFDLAKKLIDSSIKSGANCAKFQMRDLSSLYINAGNADDARENLGSQYTLDLLSRFQLSPDEMFALFDYCKKHEIMPLCTPWDLNSLRLLEQYGMQAYKVASADMTNHTLLQEMAKTGKPLICSTGMSDEVEIIETIKLLQSMGTQYILLQCNSTYPAPFKDINLRYMMRLAELGDCLIGYSGHERGIHVAVAAVSMGAKVIEKHITLDRNMEGNDHKVSLLPDEFSMMVEAIRQVEIAIGSDSPRQITQGERMNRANLAKSLIINCNLEIGQTIRADMIDVKSPGRGLQPNFMKDIVGKIARRRFFVGDFFYPSDLDVTTVSARDYRFKRRWGVPVRYHDYKLLLERSNPDFLEFHLSYKDMERNIEQFFDREYDLDLIVHSPDLFPGDHLLNLAADDEGQRRRSIEKLQQVIEITRSLKVYFKRASKPLIVASLGGFSKDGFVDPALRPEMYARIADSLSQLDQHGVEIVGQTLPPFPWYFGGQLFLNLFVNPKDTADFCEKYGYRLCFDVSHSKLACNHFNWSFMEFVESIGSHIAHLHIVDAKGVDGEGLQIGDGDIDFHALADYLDRVAPSATFIPEIWQGHENEGEGFWIALNRLEKWF